MLSLKLLSKEGGALEEGVQLPELGLLGWLLMYSFGQPAALISTAEGQQGVEGWPHRRRQLKLEQGGRGPLVSQRG